MLRRSDELLLLASRSPYQLPDPRHGCIRAELDQLPAVIEGLLERGEVESVDGRLAYSHTLRVVYRFRVADHDHGRDVVVVVEAILVADLFHAHHFVLVQENLVVAVELGYVERAHARALPLRHQLADGLNIGIMVPVAVADEENVLEALRPQADGDVLEDAVVDRGRERDAAGGVAVRVAGLERDDRRDEHVSHAAGHRIGADAEHVVVLVHRQPGPVVLDAASRDQDAGLARPDRVADLQLGQPLDPQLVGRRERVRVGAHIQEGLFGHRYGHLPSAALSLEGRRPQREADQYQRYPVHHFSLNKLNFCFYII